MKCEWSIFQASFLLSVYLWRHLLYWMKISLWTAQQALRLFIWNKNEKAKNAKLRSAHYLYLNFRMAKNCWVQSTFFFALFNAEYTRRYTLSNSFCAKEKWEKLYDVKQSYIVMYSSLCKLRSFGLYSTKPHFILRKIECSTYIVFLNKHPKII